MFRFSYLSDLLENLQDIACHDPPYLIKERDEKYSNTLLSWFNSYRKAIDSLNASDLAALLSSLLPQRRKDRVYGLQSLALVKILGRCLGLSATRRLDLERFKERGNGDLAECLERVLRSGGPPALPPVDLAEVDGFLDSLAGQCRFSKKNGVDSSDGSTKRDDLLRQLLYRLAPCEAKWVVRLILKDLSPISLDEGLCLRSCHFLLPDLLNMHNDLSAASYVLKTSFKAYPSLPDPQSKPILRRTAAAMFRPIPGIMVSRGEYCKARSIKHCIQMMAGQRWLLDRKYDGEYCQIHVDLDKGKDWLTIFSKSGQDSTRDRQGLHETIRTCLGIGTDTCRIKSKCIIVGEMVVFSEIEKCILSFDKIRKHVTRSGVFIGVDQDSPAHHGEHLMIVFFDLLLLDDENLYAKPVEERRAHLSQVYRKIAGRAVSAESTIIDFSRPDAERKLMQQFAAANALRHEGLVLKPCGTLTLAAQANHALFPPRLIKLKKDYISGLGDEADFAVIGASYSAQEANKCPHLGLSWTHFHLGCLMNDAEVGQIQATPVFKSVGTIAADQCIPLPILQQINAEGLFFAEKSPTAFEIETIQELRADIYFRKPFVFEVLGSSYSRPSNSGFYMLRHPRVKRLHGDRTWRDCITFDQLQNVAQQALDVPEEAESQETLVWMARLEHSCRRKFARMGCSTTPDSATSLPTPRTKMRNRDRCTNLDADQANLSSPLASRAPLCSLQRLPNGIFSTKAARLIPTPPTSSPSVGEPVLIATKTQKRLAYNTTHRTAKRIRIGPEDDESTRVDAKSPNKCVGSSPTRLGLQATDVKETNILPTSSKEKGLRLRRYVPLADVTNVPPQSLQKGAARGATPSLKRVPPNGKTVSHAQEERSAASSQTPIAANRKARKAGNRTKQRDSQEPKTSIILPTPELEPEPETCHVRKRTHRLQRNACPLSRSVVYLPSTLRTRTPQLMQMLHQYGATVIRDLSDWDRDSFATPRLTDTVGESQSYPGLTKVLLVDGRDARGLCELLAQTRRLNKGKLRESIEVYDFRLVEDSCRGGISTDVGDEGGDEVDDERLLLREHAIGLVSYDEEVATSVFVPCSSSSFSSSASTTAGSNAETENGGPWLLAERLT